MIELWLSLTAERTLFFSPLLLGLLIYRICVYDTVYYLGVLCLQPCYAAARKNFIVVLLVAMTIKLLTLDMRQSILNCAEILNEALDVAWNFSCLDDHKENRCGPGWIEMSDSSAQSLDSNLVRTLVWRVQPGAFDESPHCASSLYRHWTFHYV